LRDHASQVVEKGAIRRGMHEEVTIRRRFLEYEAVAMASGDEQRGLASFQASDQIVARPATGPGYEDACRHATVNPGPRMGGHEP